jgi:hypothetical protein
VDPDHGHDQRAGGAEAWRHGDWRRQRTAACIAHPSAIRAEECCPFHAGGVIAEPHQHETRALVRERQDDSGDAAGLALSSVEARDAFVTLIDGVRDAQTAGVLRDDDPLLIVNVLWAYTHGIACSPTFI